MAIQNLAQAYGAGTFKVVEGVASIANGGTISTGLNTIIAASLTAVAASGDYAIANIESISGGTITVGLNGAASGTAPSAITANTSVHYIVIGY